MRLFVFLLCLNFYMAAASARHRDTPPSYTRIFPKHDCSEIAYRLALRGYDSLSRRRLCANARYLSIIDYTKPSNVPRFFVIDMQEQQLAMRSITAHGVGSDPDSLTVPQRFSNRDGSRATSLGFYLTGDVYYNHRPSDSLGLCLFGLDSGYNDAAAVREIVVHYGATEYAGRVYVTDSGAARSYGCPALPLSANARIIDIIRGGSVLFVYSDKAGQYVGESTVLNGRLRTPIVQHGPPPNNCSCNIGRRF